MPTLHPEGYTLWLSSVLPSTNPKWELMAFSNDRSELERKSDQMRFMCRYRRLVILRGDKPPRWEAKL